MRTKEEILHRIHLLNKEMEKASNVAEEAYAAQDYVKFDTYQRKCNHLMDIIHTLSWVVE